MEPFSEYLYPAHVMLNIAGIGILKFIAGGILIAQLLVNPLTVATITIASIGVVLIALGGLMIAFGEAMMLKYVKKMFGNELKDSDIVIEYTHNSTQTSEDSSFIIWENENDNE